MNDQSAYGREPSYSPSQPWPSDSPDSPLDTVGRAIDDLAAGRLVLVVDDADRENEGDLLLAAAHATPEQIAFMIRHTSGVLCVAMESSALDQLMLPPMTAVNEDPKHTAYTVSVDAREGISTGISAADRCRTIRLLADPATKPIELTRPGHVFPLRAVPGGVVSRPGHTEAAVDLTHLAGSTAVGVIAEVVNDDGSMARLPDLRRFADTYGIALVSIADLLAYRRRTGDLVERAAETTLPTIHGEFRAIGFRSARDNSQHLALVMGDITDGTPVLTRVHSECLTGDVFGSQRCDCGEQLHNALAAIGERRRGVVLYLRGHEGRGIGLVAKLNAYALQDRGADTVDANLDLGLAVDARDYEVAEQILANLDVRRVDLLTNNPAKTIAFAEHGFDVTRVPIPPTPTPQNLRYLQTKRDRMGHDLPGLPTHPNAPGGEHL